MIEGIRDWVFAKDDKTCQEILQRYNGYGVLQGEFVKAILKINAVAYEIQMFCSLPEINNIKLMNICSQIPEKILKSVATNESLYVSI